MELSYFDEVTNAINSAKSFNDEIKLCAKKIYNSLVKGNTLFIIGNGGSAADAQHIAAEIVGRYKEDRKGYRAIALTTDTSILTSISNDYNYSYVFKRQLESLAKPGDILLVLSTSGNSENVLQAVDYANNSGILTISLTGKDGGKLKGICNHEFIINSTDTGIIQIVHSTIYHLLCSFIDKMLINLEKDQLQ